MKRVLTYAITLSVVFAASQLAAQPQGLRKFANRLEGKVTVGNQRYYLELLGLHRTFASFRPGSNLRVRFFAPGESSGIVIRAVELADREHYLMESLNKDWTAGQWADFMPWPTSDVIDVWHIPSSNLGVKAYYDKKSRVRVYLPVDVLDTDRRTSSNRYRIHFRVGSAVQGIGYEVSNAERVVEIKSPPRFCARQANPRCVLYDGGEQSSIDVDFSGLKSGMYTVLLEAFLPSSESSTPVTLSITLWHERQ